MVHGAGTAGNHRVPLAMEMVVLNIAPKPGGNWVTRETRTKQMQ